MTDLLNIDSCNIFEYVNRIDGFPSESASPTDTIKLSFKDGLLFDDKKLTEAFMKIYVSSTSDSSDRKFESDFSKKKAALLYEQKVYELIRTLIRVNYCPYFVQIYANGIDCDLNSFISLLEKQGVPRYIATMLAYRSTYYMIFQADNRPSVTNTRHLLRYLNLTEQKEQRAAFQDFVNRFDINFFSRFTEDTPNLLGISGMDIKVVNNFLRNIDNKFNFFLKTKYNFMINENIVGEKGSSTLNFYIRKYDERRNVQFSSYLNMIFLQLFIALYGLGLVKMNHNDLHLGNFWITNVPRRNVSYKIEDKIYVFDNLGIEVKIYDFDFSYFEKAGGNTFLDPEPDGTCWLDLCNKFEEKRDIAHLCLKFKNYIDNEYDKLEKDIMVDKKELKELKRDFDNEYKKIERTVNIDYKSQFNPNFSYYMNKRIAQGVRNPLDILKVQLREANAIESKNNVYEYNINQKKADSIVKYSNILIEAFSSKLSITGIKKIGEINRKYKKKFLTLDQSAREIEKIKQQYSRSVSEEERKELFTALSETTEGKRTRCLSEEDFVGNPSLVNYFGDWIGYLKSNPICRKRKEKESPIKDKRRKLFLPN